MYYYDPPSGGNNFRIETQDLKKVLACIGIIVIVLLSKRWDTPVTNFVVSKVKYLVSDYHYEPQKIAQTLRDTIQDIGAVQTFLPTKETALEAPVTGELASSFGRRWHPILQEDRMHNGIDISAPEGTPVRAALDGVVVEVAEEKELGKVVRLRHSQGITTVYGHLKDTYVKTQDNVKQGLIIGCVGKSGLAEAAHLHFEVWEGDKAQDPEKWLKLR